MKKRRLLLKAINTTADGLAFTIRARYDGAGLTNLTGGGAHFPCTGVLEIEDSPDRTDMEKRG